MKFCVRCKKEIDTDSERECALQHLIGSSHRLCSHDVTTQISSVSRVFLNGSFIYMVLFSERMNLSICIFWRLQKVPPFGWRQSVYGCETSPDGSWGVVFGRLTWQQMQYDCTHVERLWQVWLGNIARCLYMRILCGHSEAVNYVAKFFHSA
jgi:hypothetical protein